MGFRAKRTVRRMFAIESRMSQGRRVMAARISRMMVFGYVGRGVERGGGGDDAIMAPSTALFWMHEGGTKLWLRTGSQASDAQESMQGKG